MAKIRPIQMNFAGGEFSPYMEGRVDFEKYYTGVKTLENFLTFSHGGAIRRNGTRYVASAKNDNKSVRLIPFQFNVEQAYIIEAGDLYFRFFMNHGQVLSPDSYTKLLLHCDGEKDSTSLEDSGVTGHTVTANGNAKIDTLYKVFGSGSATFDGDGDYLSVPDHDDFNLSGGTWTIDFRMMPGPIGGNRTIFHHGNDADNYMQIYIYGGTGPLYHPNHVVLKIVSGGTVLVNADIAYQMYVGTWYHIAVIANGINYKIYINGSMKLQANTADKPTNYTGLVLIGGIAGGYYKGHLDEFRVSNGIERWTDNFAPPSIPYPLPGESSVTEKVTPYKEEDLAGLKWVQSADTMYIVHPKYKPKKLTRTSHIVWNLDDCSFTAMPAEWTDGNGWPEAISFHEERLLFAGTKNYPQTIWGSKSGDYLNMTTGTADDDAFVFTIAANEVNKIRWINPGRVLLLGTAGGEFKMYGGDSDFISPTNVTVKSETVHGCENIMPFRVGSAHLMVQRAGRKLRELVYSFDSDTYIAPDLSLLAEHITAPRINEITMEKEPWNLLWAVKNDGNMVTMTYLREQNVVGWARHTTDGLFLSAATIPAPDGSRDETWIAVRRTIGGNPKTYIEWFVPDVYVDSHLIYSGAPVTAVSGLSHLEGKTVQILGDGAVYPDAMVTSGSVTLDGPAASLIYVGLGFTSTIVTLRPEANLGGTVQGKAKSWSGLWVRIHESKGFTVNGERVVMRDPSQPMGEPTALFSGDVSIQNLGWDNDGRITIVQEEPLPCTILAVFGNLEIYD